MTHKGGLEPTPPDGRFWAKVEKGPGCWEWRGSIRFPQGYGQLRIGSMGDGTRTMISTHRFSWLLHFGPIPEGQHVCHRCDNKRCVRPDHLFLGTHTENMRDMLQKGRGRWVTSPIPDVQLDKRPKRVLARTRYRALKAAGASTEQATASCRGGPSFERLMTKLLMEQSQELTTNRQKRS